MLMPVDGFIFDRTLNNNLELINVVSKRLKNEKTTNGLNPSKEECDAIISYIKRLSLEKPTLIEGKDSELPFSTAYNPKSKKIYCLLKEQLSECDKIALCWDIDTLSKVVFKLGVKTNESEISKLLSKHRDLFVATNDVQHYCHYNGKMDSGTVLVLEHLKCSLHDLINDNRLNLKSKISIACDIAKALDALHNKFKVVHRHLKFEHILVDENYRAKISNFKDSVVEKNIPTNGLGSDYYLPPEWLQTWSKHRLKEKYEYPKADFSSDIWCFGVLLLLLFSEKVTQDRWYASWNNKCYNIRDISKIKDCILKEMVELSLEHEKGIMEEICKLIRNCLKVDPSNRINAQKIVGKFNEINAFHLERPSDSSSESTEESNHLSDDSLNRLNSLHINKEDLVKIVNYVRSLPLHKNWVFKRKIHKLPFTAAYDANDDNIIIFPNANHVGRLGQSANCNVTKGWDVKAQSIVAIRSGGGNRITQNEVDFNKLLSRRKDLFVVSDKVFEYEGTFTYNAGEFNQKQKCSKPIPKRAIILEVINNSLADVKNVTIDHVIFIGQAIAKALKVLHEEFGIVHRDLKKDNILISVGDGPIDQVKIKLADFGFAHKKGNHTMCWGRNHYIPPEVILDRLQFDKEFYNDVNPGVEIRLKLQQTPRNADYPEDIWALGVILLELICEETDFKIWKTMYLEQEALKSDFGIKKNKLFDIIKESYESISHEDKEKLNDLLYIIGQCLQYNPKDRPDADRVLNYLDILGAQ